MKKTEKKTFLKNQKTGNLDKENDSKSISATFDIERIKNKSSITVECSTIKL